MDDEPERLLESSGAESESPSNVRERGLAKAKESKPPSVATVAGHPQGKQTRPNNKKKKKKRKGEDTFHECCQVFCGGHSMGKV